MKKHNKNPVQVGAWTYRSIGTSTSSTFWRLPTMCMASMRCSSMTFDVKTAKWCWLIILFVCSYCGSPSCSGKFGYQTVLHYTKYELIIEIIPDRKTEALTRHLRYPMNKKVWRSEVSVGTGILWGSILTDTPRDPLMLTEMMDNWFSIYSLKPFRSWRRTTDLRSNRYRTQEMVIEYWIIPDLPGQGIDIHRRRWPVD